MISVNGTKALTAAEIAARCGITRQGFEWWIKTRIERFPPDYTVEMGRQTIQGWLPTSVDRIVEARQP